MIPLWWIVSFSLILFVIGLYCFMRSQNAVKILMGIEIMLNAANINLVAFSIYKDVNLVTGQVAAIFSISIAAAEAAIGLAIFLVLYRNFTTIDATVASILKH